MAADTSGCGQRVLVVEDDPHICELLAHLLHSRGREVEIVGDGVDALQRIKSVDPEVILLDLMLPRLNGFEVVRELAALDPEKLGRIIVLTAASESTLKDFHIGSIYRLIKKPFDITDLLQAVDDCAARNGH